jgi:hypothetical protein
MLKFMGWVNFDSDENSTKHCDGLALSSYLRFKTVWEAI